MEHPRILYETPDHWGMDKFWLTHEQLVRTVRELREMGWEVSEDHARRWMRVEGDVYEDLGEPARPEDGWACHPYKRVVRLRYVPDSDAWELVEVLEEHPRRR
jgi:hypothetical protein